MNLCQITSERKTLQRRTSLSLLCGSVCECVLCWRTQCTKGHLCRTLFVCVRECVCMCVCVCAFLSWMSRCMKAFETDILSQSKDGLQWKSERQKERKRAFFHNRLQPSPSHSLSLSLSPPSFPPSLLTQSNSTSFFLFFSPSLPPSPRLARINDFTLNRTPIFTHTHNNTHNP